MTRLTYLILPFTLLLAPACDLQGLQRRDLYQPTLDSTPGPDTGPAESVDAGDAGNTEDALTGSDLSAGNGTLSGVVTSQCDGHGIAALVGIAGKHQCSFPVKGSFFFQGVPTGVRLTLTSAAPGYNPWSQEITVDAGGTANVKIVLDPEVPDGCAALPLLPPTCTCGLPDCV